MMNKKNIWTIVIVVVLVILGIVLLSNPKTKTAQEATTAPEQTGGEQKPAEAVVPGQTITPEKEILREAKVVVPETSPISEQGTVLTPEGKPADNAAIPGSPEAPRQSRSLTEAEIPNEAIKLSVSAAGFEPKEFTVKAGKPVTISVTSTDKTHVFKFDDPGLQAIAIGVAGNETRAITFNAPAAGDYSFFCDVPGHRGRGETGVMHVK